MAQSGQKSVVARSRVSFAVIVASCITMSAAFSAPTLIQHRNRNIQIKRGDLMIQYTQLKSNEDVQKQVQEKDASSYDTSEASSKGIVSTLTGIVNFIMGEEDTNNETGENDEIVETIDSTMLCTSPQQLRDKIKDDYVVNNYLWTGDIYLPAFEPNCQFTDPTLSFVGRDKFVSNVQNLLPIVDFLTKEEDICKSDLLDIKVNEEEGYVESRWNMVGQLSVLPWKPCIDVIGRTKFWYRDSKMKVKMFGDDTDDEIDQNLASGLRVYFYDEMWEMPAGKALLQLVTPGGTISSQK